MEIARPMRYRIDVKDPLQKDAMAGILAKGDKNANRVIVDLYDGEMPIELGSAKVTGKFYRDEDAMIIPLEGKAEGNTATVMLIDHCYAMDSGFTLSIKTTIGETARTILMITGRVITDGEGRYMDVTGIVPNIDAIIAQYAEMKRVTQEAIDATEAAKDETEVVKGIRTAAEAALDDAREATEAADGWYRAGAEITMLAAEDAASISVETNETGAKIVKFQIPRGFTGLTPQITFQIATGEPGTNATIAQSGTAENPVLLLTIPRGDTGDIGNLKINGVGLSADGTITLTADDVGALDASRIADDLTTERSNYALSARAGAQLQKEKQPMIDKSNAAAVRGVLGLGETTGALSVARGGTGATSATEARKKLYLGDIATKDIQNGWVTLTAASGRNASQEIVFPKPFNTIPVVMATCSGGQPIHDSCTVQSITATGCKIWYGNRDGNGEDRTVSVAWMAIGYLADETEG